MQEIISSDVNQFIQSNMETKYNKFSLEKIIENLLINYKLLEMNYVNICTNQQQNLQIDIDLILLQQTIQKINMQVQINKCEKIVLYHNLSFSINKQPQKRERNIFLFLLSKYLSNVEIYLLYNHEINNILIINLHILNNLLENNPYQEFYENNTLILISNYEDYGKNIHKKLKKLIIFCFKAFISELQNQSGYNYLEKYLYNTKEEYEYFNENKEEILEFNESFIKYYCYY